MATYQELDTILSTNDGTTAALRSKIKIAALVACDAIRQEAVNTANHAARVAWAVQVMQNPGAQVDRILAAVLAQNTGATSAAILAASDATVQTAVTNAINLLAGGVA